MIDSAHSEGNFSAAIGDKRKGQYGALGNPDPSQWMPQPNAVYCTRKILLRKKRLFTESMNKKLNEPTYRTDTKVLHSDRGDTHQSHDQSKLTNSIFIAKKTQQKKHNNKHTKTPH